MPNKVSSSSSAASFDAVFSIFGVIMVPDWRKGLAEMARVTLKMDIRRNGREYKAGWMGISERQPGRAATAIRCEVAR